MPLPGSLKNILRGGRARNGTSGSANSSFPSRKGGGDQILSTRPSRGLEEFFGCIRDQSGLTILDLGGVTQQNVSFITNLGHRLYSEDFLQILRETFGEDGGLEQQSNPGQIEYFLREVIVKV